MSGNDRGRGSSLGHCLFLVFMWGVVILGVVVSIVLTARNRIANLGQSSSRYIEEVFHPFLNEGEVSVNDAIECLHTTTSSSQGMPSPAPSPTSPSISKLSGDELNQLRYHALRLINNDRAAHGLPPVVLGANIAAQLHAEDMLVNDYFGHWWADGRKPYMVYTQTGGTSYVSENVATSGWTYDEWVANGCNTSYVLCEVPTPKEVITDHQWGMMYDDAHADWGHRDNILGKTHRAVNIGIGFNGLRTTFVQHFEGGAVQADELPVLDQNDNLCLSLSKRETGTDVGGISIAYDPPPTPKTPTQIDALNRYCTGGGFTAHCPEFDAATILEPPLPGRYYSNLNANEVVASRWVDSPSHFTMAARMGSLLKKPGVYTVIVWRDDGEEWFSEKLIALSLFVE